LILFDFGVISLGEYVSYLPQRCFEIVPIKLDIFQFLFEFGDAIGFPLTRHRHFSSQQKLHGCAAVHALEQRLKFGRH